MASPDVPRQRFATTFAFASALHVVAVFTIGRVKGEQTPAHPNSVPAAVEFEVTTVAPAPDPVPHAPFEHAPSAVGERVQAASARAREGHRSAPRADAPPSDAPTTPPFEGAYTADPASPSSGPGPGSVDLGVRPGDWARWVDPDAQTPPETAKVEPPRSAPAPLSTTGGVAEALEAHDRNVGMGHSGPVLSAAREAAHADAAPATGTATFAVTVSGTGAVDVQLTGASSQAGSWREIARRMAEAIARKPPRVRAPRQGVRLALEVIVAERWPNGQIARGEGPAVALAGGALRSTEAAKDSLAARNPAALPPPGSPSQQPTLEANADVAGVYVAGRGKVCNYRAGLTPLGPLLQGGCDPSNIGAAPQRVVSTRVVSEVMF